MPNNIAYDSTNNLVHSKDIYNLRNTDKRIQARETAYHCPHCKTEMCYSHSGSEGCFKHIPSTPSNVKEHCPFYYGLLAGCSREEAIVIEEKRSEVQTFLRDNGITGFTVISYFSEPELVKYIQRYPDEDFIIVGNKLTDYERNSLNDGHLILRKKAIAKYLSSNNKPILQTFAGTSSDKICLMKVEHDLGSDVSLKPYILSINNLRLKQLLPTNRLMIRNDIIDIRETIGKHDNRAIPYWMR
jgi:hypothetical protein